MSYYPGAIDQYGRRWVRCEQCGDSMNRNHAHRAVYPDGGSWCFKCSTYEDTTIADLMELLMVYAETRSYEPKRQPVHLEPRLIDNRRLTHLDTYSGPNRVWDYFNLRDQHGTIRGWYGRNPFAREFDANGVGFGYVGDSLVSSPSRPLTVVEGPYDVINEQCVCLFGSLSYGRLKSMKLHNIWLWPDPDAIETKAQRITFWNMMESLRDNTVLVEGVILSDADPDEAVSMAHFRFDEDKYNFCMGKVI